MAKSTETPNTLATELINYLKPGQSMLELGAGVGSDARFFAEQGLNVVATDFSDAIIEENKQKFAHISNLSFEKLDIQEIDKLEDNKFDVIYSRLSLHYFNDVDTKRIFTALADKLKSGGILSFVCKSIHDQYFGQGEEIEKNVFMLKGHIRHFFDQDYVHECLGDRFEIIKMDYTDETFADGTSGFINVIARKV